MLNMLVDSSFHSEHPLKVCFLSKDELELVDEIEENGHVFSTRIGKYQSSLQQKFVRNVGIHLLHLHFK